MVIPESCDFCFFLRECPVSSLRGEDRPEFTRMRFQDTSRFAFGVCREFESGFLYRLAARRAVAAALLRAFVPLDVDQSIFSMRLLQDRT